MPSYRLRTHPRARHLRFRVEAGGELVVTVPRGLDRRRIPDLIAERADWIEAARQRLAGERARLDPAVAGPRPTRIDLPAVGESWPIRYASGQIESAGLTEQDAGLVLRLPAKWSGAEAAEPVAGCLQRWLKRRARRALVPWVEALAEEHDLDIGRITIRNQRSRWGSCSSTGNLSLNARLLFCAPSTCRYVLIHELVHIEHPNHSAAFWRRVVELDPAYRAALAELKSVWQRLPEWMDY